MAVIVPCSRLLIDCLGYDLIAILLISKDTSFKKSPNFWLIIFFLSFADIIGIFCGV